MSIVYARVNPSSQQSEHIRVGVVFTSAWQSVDVDAATRTALFADPFLQASDTDPGGSSGITINEDNPTKVRTYSALIKRPAAAEFGVGVCQIGGVLSVSDGSSWSGVGSGGATLRLKTLVIGDSLVTQGIVTGTAAAPQLIGRSESHLVNFFAGGVLEFPETSAIVQATYVGHAGISRDSHYSYSGATSTSILADIDAYLIPSLQASKVIYDLLLIPALFDNDISASVPTATSISNAKSIIAKIKSVYPDILVVIGTSRPSSFFDTAPEKALFTATYAAVLALDNGSTIRAYAQGYDYASADGTTPVVIGVTGTIAGTTMTITSVNSNPTGIKLQIGMQVIDAGHAITSVPDNLGGIGVYGVNTGLTISGNFTVMPYTDGDGAGLGGIHTNGFGTSLNARKAAAVIKQLGASNKNRNLILSGIKGLVGSTAVNATTNVTGTRPPGVTFTGSATSTLVAEALQPGLRLSYSAIGDSAVMQDLAYLAFDIYTLPQAVDGYRMIVRARIVSGADYIAQIDLANRQTDNGVLLNPTNTWFSNGTGAAGGITGVSYHDGDELTFISPVIRSGGVGALITAITSYLHIRAKAKTSIDVAIVVDLLDVGYELVTDGAEIATLVAGTVTINDSRVRTGSKIRFWRVIDGGTVGSLKETARVSGISVTIGSFNAAGAANAADTSQIRYVIE